MEKPNIRLRALTKSDLAFTLDWHNKAEISDLYAGHPFPVNVEMESKWYDKILGSNFPLTVFGIEIVQEKKLIGISILKDINLINRSSEFAIYIGDDNYVGKGLSKEAALQTLRFGFHKLGLNRVFLKVREDNAPALRLYKSVGFKEEGKLRDSVFKSNRFKSEFIMSILKDEFNGAI